MNNKFFKHILRIFLFASLFMFGKLYAQELPSIQTDRPDQTECPFIVPKNHFQMETGFLFEHAEKNFSNYAHPGALMKYGINKRFELRLVTEINTIRENGKAYTGLSPVAFGFKVNLAKEKGIIPTTSLIAHLSVPSFASDKFTASYYAPYFRFTMQHTLSDKFSLSYNLGAEWDGENKNPAFIYTLTSGYAITEKLGAYAELYGFAPHKDKADHRCDGGFTYLLRNNIMVDISGGVGLSSSSPEYYMALGFSFRLKD